MSDKKYANIEKTVIFSCPNCHERIQLNQDVCLNCDTSFSWNINNAKELATLFPKKNIWYNSDNAKIAFIEGEKLELPVSYIYLITKYERN